MSEEHEETGRTLAWKAMLITAGVARQKGDQSQADMLYHRALAAAEKRLGENNIVVALVLMEIAEYYDSLRQHQRSEPLYCRVREILSACARDVLDSQV